MYTPATEAWEHLVPSVDQAGWHEEGHLPRAPSTPVSLCPQASLAQQLCRQHVIAGQHLLEDLATLQQTRKWWTLAGQEITVTFNRFMVRRGNFTLGTEGVTGDPAPG